MTQYRSIELEVQKRPMPFLAWLRREAPIYHDPDTGVFFITRDEDLRRVAMDPTNFSSVIDPTVFRVVQGKSLEQSDPEVAERLKARGWLVPTTLLLTDPPDHTRFRRLMQEALSPKSVEQMSPHLRTRINALLDEFPADGHVEFVADFAKRLPIWTVGRFIFGAPEADFQMINDWSDQFFLTLMPGASREEYLRTVDTVIEMHRYIKANIDRFREQHDEGVLLSRLIRVHEKTGDTPLSDEEMISMMQVMLLAGHDTTRQTLANSLFELARQPELVARMRADRSLVPKFINEVLRMHAAANVTSRIARVDTDINGTLIPAGSMVFMAWGSANRDERVHPDPDRFDVDRPDARNHLSFGWGIHHCVGAHLARAQIALSLEQVLDRYTGITLDVAESEIDYAPSMNTRTLMRLPLALHA